VPSWRGLLILFALVLVGGPFIWHYLIRPQSAKWEAWEGVVVERFQRHYQGRYGELTTYHLRVECPDGRRRNVDVTGTMWIGMNVGTRLRKTKGERWPRIVGAPNGLNLLEKEMGKDFPKQLRPLVPVSK